MTKAATLCYCGSGQLFVECCQKFIHRRVFPQTAEQLMRSRYSAYVVEDTHYLQSTWHHSTRPTTLDLNSQIRWIGLQIKNTQAGQETDSGGSVEFVARYKINGRAYRLHEVSDFVKEQLQWFYVSGHNSAE